MAESQKSGSEAVNGATAGGAPVARSASLTARADALSVRARIAAVLGVTLGSVVGLIMLGWVVGTLGLRAQEARDAGVSLSVGASVWAGLAAAVLLLVSAGIGGTAMRRPSKIVAILVLVGIAGAVVFAPIILVALTGAVVHLSALWYDVAQAAGRGSSDEDEGKKPGAAKSTSGQSRARRPARASASKKAPTASTERPIPPAAKRREAGNSGGSAKRGSTAK